MIAVSDYMSCVCERVLLPEETRVREGTPSCTLPPDFSFIQTAAGAAASAVVFRFRDDGNKTKMKPNPSSCGERK